MLQTLEMCQCILVAQLIVLTSIVWLPCLFVVWGMASQLQTAITVILTGFYLENLFWGEAKAVPNVWGQMVKKVWVGR